MRGTERECEANREEETQGKVMHGLVPKGLMRQPNRGRQRRARSYSQWRGGHTKLPTPPPRLKKTSPTCSLGAQPPEPNTVLKFKKIKKKERVWSHSQSQAKMREQVLQKHAKKTTVWLVFPRAFFFEERMRVIGRGD